MSKTVELKPIEEKVLNVSFAGESATIVFTDEEIAYILGEAEELS